METRIGQVSDLSGFAQGSDRVNTSILLNSLYWISCRTTMRKILVERGGKDI